MRLLIISHAYVRSDARGKVRALAQHAQVSLLVPRAWRSHMFAQPADPEPDPAITLLTAPVALPGRIIRYVYAPWVLRRHMEQVRPEAVLVEEEPCSLALAQAALLKPRLGFRLCFFTWENIYWQPLLTHRVERFNLARSDGAIAGNSEAADVLRRKGYGGPVAIIPQMGVEVAPDAAPADLPASPFVVAFVGLLVETKGLRVLVEALESWACDWALLVVGTGPLEGWLRERAAQQGWAARLRLAGFLPRPEVDQALRQAHVLVLPSLTRLTRPRAKEQFGRVLAEAMAQGVAVIGSDSGAIPEVVGDAGLIVPEGDAAALRAALERLRANPDARLELARRGVARARALYTNTVLARQVLDFVRAA